MASAVVVFAAGVFATVAAAVADAARDASTRRKTKPSVLRARRGETTERGGGDDENVAAASSSSPENDAETTSETRGFVPERADLSRPANEALQKTAEEETSANDVAAERMNKTDDDVREDASAKTPPANGRSF